jgi:hypothetical protein
LVHRHCPEIASRSYRSAANQVRSTVITATRSWCCEYGS